MAIIKNYLNMAIPRVEDECSVQDALEIFNRTGAQALFLYENNTFQRIMSARDLAGYPLTRLVLDCRGQEYLKFSENDQIEKALSDIQKKDIPSHVIFDSYDNPVGIIDFGKVISGLLYRTGASEDPAEDSDRKLMDKISNLENKAQFGNLFIGLIHDLNNILTAVSGYTDLAMIENESAEEYSQKQKLNCRLKNIKTAVERCVQYILNVSSFTGIKKRNELLNIKDEVKNVIELFSPVMTKSQIEINADLENSDNLVAGNRSNIFNIISNLFKNSREAISENGAIFVRIDNKKIIENTKNQLGFEIKSGNYIELQVSDNGKGIAVSDINEIFKPFFTTKENGTGIGLVNVKREVEDMEGFIEVKSEEGVGTSFSIFLPQATTRDKS